MLSTNVFTSVRTWKKNVQQAQCSKNEKKMCLLIGVWLGMPVIFQFLQIFSKKIKKKIVIEIYVHKVLMNPNCTF